MANITEWWNSNSDRSYPFEENSDFSTNEGVQIPLSLILDFMFFDTNKMYQDKPLGITLESIDVENLKNIAFEGEHGFANLVFHFKVDNVSKVYYSEHETTEAYFSVRAQFLGTRRQDERFYYAISFVPVFVGTGSGPSLWQSYVKMVSSIKIGDPSYNIEDGTYTFKNPPKILPTRLIQFLGPRGLGSIEAATPAGASGFLTGTVYLHNGKNTTLHLNGNTIVLDIGPGYGDRSDCDDRPCSATDSLLFINGQRGNPNGDFIIEGGQGIDVISSGEYTPTSSAGASESVPAIKIIPTKEVTKLFN